MFDVTAQCLLGVTAEGGEDVLVWPQYSIPPYHLISSLQSDLGYKTGTVSPHHTHHHPDLTTTIEQLLIRSCFYNNPYTSIHLYTHLKILASLLQDTGLSLVCLAPTVLPLVVRPRLPGEDVRGSVNTLDLHYVLLP